MNKLKRGIHIDFHTMPGIYDFGRDFDAAEFARRLDEANVTIINMFAQCNLGFSYYPTKIGIPYPTMKGDMFGSILKECHARNIKVIAYINIGLNHEMARKHYDWCRLDAEGRVIRGDRTANFFRTMCYNTGYGEYLLALIREIVENYDADGVFCDCMVREPCYCNDCTEDMVEEGINIDDAASVSAFSHRVMLDISKKIRDVVPSDKLLYLNGMKYDEVNDYERHIEVECLPSGGWGYDYFIPQASYARNLQKDVLYMTGRFQASWGDFGGFKSKASVENDIYDALCQGIEYSVGDHMHPAENLERDIYKIVGEIYSRTMKYEKWTDSAVYQSDIGVVINRYSGYSTTLAGIARMLSELKLSFDVVNEFMDLSKFKLLILPDSTVANDMLGDKLRAFADAGGKILSSGFGGFLPDKSGFALSEFSDYLTFEGADSSNSPYYRTKELITEADMTYAMYTPGILMTAKSGADTDVIADYIKPYFNRQWNGFHGYFYTPPEKATGQTAAAVNGNTAHICFNIFASYNRYASVFHKKLVEHIIAKLLPNPLIRASQMPSTSRVTLTGNDSYKLLHVKTSYPEPRGPMGIIEEHVTLPAGREVSVRGEYKAAKLLPCETPVKSVICDGYTTVTLPEICGYDMFLLE